MAECLSFRVRQEHLNSLNIRKLSDFKQKSRKYVKELFRKIFFAKKFHNSFFKSHICNVYTNKFFTNQSLILSFNIIIYQLLLI